MNPLNQFHLRLDQFEPVGTVDMVQSTELITESIGIVDRYSHVVTLSDKEVQSSSARIVANRQNKTKGFALKHRCTQL